MFAMRTFHLRFAAGLLLVLSLLGVGVYFLHQHQLGRIAVDLRAQIDSARDADNIDNAIRLTYQYLEFKPDDANTLVELAGWLESRGNSRKNMAHVAGLLDRALQIVPKRTELRRRVVAINLKIGQWSECLDHLERLLPESPDDAELLANLGVCQEAIAKHAEAAANFEKSLKIDPKRVATALDYSALLQRHLQRPDDACRVLQTAIERNPTSTEARLGLARLLKANGKLNEAADAAHEAVRVAPNDLTVLTTAAEMEQAAGHYASARTYLAKAREISPQTASLACSLAWLLLSEGKAAEATAELESALKTHPDNADVLTLLGDILALDGRIADLERIVGELQRLRTSDPTRGWNADYLNTRLMMRRNDFVGAARLLEELRLSSARRPGLAKQTNFLQAQCYEQLHDRAKELAAYRRIIDADQQAGYFRLEFARALARAGDFPAAVLEYRAALQKNDLPVRTVIEVAGEIADRCLRFGGEAALKDLEGRLAAIRADDANVHAVIAKIELLHRRQKTGDALRLTQQYLARHKNQVEVVSLQIRLMDAFHGPTRAAAALDEAIQRLGDQADFRVAKLHLLGMRPEGAGPVAFAIANDVDKCNPEERSRILSELVTSCGSNADSPSLADALERLRVARPDHLAVRSALLTFALMTGDEPAMSKLLAEVAAVEGPDGKSAKLFGVERCIAQRNLPAAREQLNELAKSVPNDPVVLFLLGRVDELEDRNAAARKNYTDSLNAGFLDQPVEMLVAALGHGDASTRKVRVLVEESPLFERMRLDIDRTLIRHLLPLASASSRAALADRLLANNPTASAPQLLWLGRLFQQHGLSRNAEATLARATAIAPLSDEAWSVRLGYHASRQDMAKVQELIVQAKQTLPANEASIILAKALGMAGLKAEALGQVQAAVAFEPSNPTARRQLVQQLLQTGRIAEARQELQSFVDQPGIAADEASWARRTLAVNLTIAPSLPAFQKSRQLLDANKSASGMSDDDVRAMATVFAAQRNRLVEGQPARQIAIRMLGEIKNQQASDLVLLARTCRNESDTNRYNQILAELETKYGNDFAAQLFLAEEALRDEQLAKADQCLTNLQRIDANRFERLVVQCARLAMAGQGDAARAILEQYIRSAPDAANRAARQVRCGHALFEIVQEYPVAEHTASTASLREAAINWYVAGLGRDPQALFHLVTLMCKSGRIGEALEFLQTPAVRGSFSPEAQAVAFATMVRQGEANAQQLQAIERMFRSWSQKLPNSIAIQLALADLYEAQKQTNKATYIYRDILNRDPDNLNALNNLAWTSLSDPAKIPAGLRLIQDAIDRHGHLDELLDTRGRLLFASGQQVEGIRDMQEAAASSPSAARFFQLAVMHRRANQPEAAAMAMKQAKRFGLTPTDVPPQDVAEYREMTVAVSPPS